MVETRKIYLENNNGCPFVVISKNGELPAVLEVEKGFDERVGLRLSEDDFVKINYKGRKLDDCSVNLEKTRIISNLEIREIGILTEGAYFNLLRSYISYQASIGGKCPLYSKVKNDAYDQLSKMKIKK